MPVIVQKGLPAVKILKSENIPVAEEDRIEPVTTAETGAGGGACGCAAASACVKRGGNPDREKPLEILFLNLMPTKEITETQFIRLLGLSPLKTRVTLLRTSHVPTHVSPEHMRTFYKYPADVKDNRYDGMIITGAAVEKLPFEDVDYWDELCEIMDWAASHVRSTIYICWGAQAGLYHRFGVEKYRLPAKISGIYPQKRVGDVGLMDGFPAEFSVPQSRYTSVARDMIEADERLKILSESERTGVYIVEAPQTREIFVTGHSEYDSDTLAREYRRDIEAGLDPAIPENYFPGDDPDREPVCTWRESSARLFSNWLKYYVSRG